MKYEYSVNGKTYTLPEEEVQAFLKHYPNAELIREISDPPGKQTGVAGEAATVAPDEIAAATGLASGTSLSESPSLAAPLQTPIAQEINDPIKQTSLPSNFPPFWYSFSQLLATLGKFLCIHFLCLSDLNGIFSP